MKKVDKNVIKQLLNDPQFIVPAPPRTNRDCDKIKMDVDTHLEGKDVHYAGSVPTLTNSPTVKKYRRVAARILITAIIMLSILIGSGVVAYQRNLIDFHNGTLIFNFSDIATEPSMLQYTRLKKRILESGISPLYLPQIFEESTAEDIKISTTDLSTVAQFTVVLTVNNQKINVMCSIEAFTDPTMMDNYAVSGADDFKKIETANAEVYLTTNEKQTDIRYAIGKVIYNMKVAADLDTAVRIAKTI